MAAADDPADRAFAADRGDLDRAAAASARRPARSSSGRTGNRLASTWSPRLQDDLAGGQLDHLAEGLDQRARLAREGREQAIAGEGLVGLVSSSVVVSCHLHIPATAGTVVTHGGPAFAADNAPSAKLLHQLSTGSTVVRLPTSRQSATRRSGATSTRLRALVDQVDEVAVDVGIFAGPVVGLRLAVERAAARRRLRGAPSCRRRSRWRSSIPRLRCGASRGWQCSGPSASGLAKTMSAAIGVCAFSGTLSSADCDEQAAGEDLGRDREGVDARDRTRRSRPAPRSSAGPDAICARPRARGSPSTRCACRRAPRRPRRRSHGAARARW